MNTRIIISDITLHGHPEIIRDAISTGYGEDISLNIEIRNSGFSEDIAYAAQIGAEALIRSTTGFSSHIDEALQYYILNDIQTFMTLGSNDPIRIDSPSEIPVIITAGAGTEENQTAFGPALEFFDNYTEEGAANLSSFSNGIILGKILKIKDTLQCSWWEARWRARQTADSPDELCRSEQNGYGKINIPNALQYKCDIPADPYKTGEQIIELTNEVEKLTGENQTIGEENRELIEANNELAVLLAKCRENAPSPPEDKSGKFIKNIINDYNYNFHNKDYNKSYIDDKDYTESNNN